MIHPEKWRETADPFSVSFRDFQLLRVLGYPHAGNDVFQVEGLWQGACCRAFLKIQRQPGADIAREVRLLEQLPLTNLPPLLEWSAGGPAWLLTKELPGERLSTILGDNAGMASLAWLPEYGRTLAAVHRQKPDAPPVADRKFFRLPSDDLAEAWGLQAPLAWCRSHPPAGESRCFVHGDFHYANLLWQGKNLTALLDWELAGMGIREFDLAWAVFRRPGQRFLSTWQEVDSFLSGYDLPYSKAAFCRYYVQIALWFFPMGDDDDRALWRALIKAAMED